uniref:Uncharacterized protein n=1 Tax=Arundo donax TaxID=35708 RepID=A0A0A9G6L6_ARUDO
MSKLRTASFQGEEDDEPMSPHYIHARISSTDSAMTASNNSLRCYALQFGTLPFNEKYSKNDKMFTTAGLFSKISFKGSKLLGKEQKKKPESCVYWFYASADHVKYCGHVYVLSQAKPGDQAASLIRR